MAVASSPCESFWSLWRAACSPRWVYFLVPRSRRSVNHTCQASANSFESKGNTTPSLLDVLFFVLLLVLVEVSFGDAASPFWVLCLPILGMLPARVVTQRTRPLKVTSTKPRSASFRRDRPMVFLETPYSDWIVSFDFMNDRPLPVNESISASKAFSTKVRSLSNHISAAIHTPLKFRSIQNSCACEYIAGVWYLLFSPLGYGCGSYFNACLQCLR